MSDAKRARREPAEDDEAPPPSWARALQGSLAAMQAQIDASRLAMLAQGEALAARVTAQGAALMARLDAIENTLDTEFADPLRKRYLLDKRRHLSAAEEVLAIPYLSKRSIMSYLTQDEARPLRAASRACRDAVAEHAWGIKRYRENGLTSRIKGSLASWRRCFPRAVFANMRQHQTVTDGDMVHLKGVRTLYMFGCKLVTDTGLAHLSGIHTLFMAGCALITDAGLAHLRGIQALYMSDCTLVTDAGLAHLSGIHTLNMTGCTLVTDAGLAHLSGINTLQMRRCALVTDESFRHLYSLRTLFMDDCPLVTDTGLAHLSALLVLSMDGCTAITIAGLMRLATSLKLLYARRCPALDAENTLPLKVLGVKITL